jgi:hypothetical protein
VREETNRDLEPNLARDGFDVFERQLERTRVPVVLEMPQRRTFFVQESGDETTVLPQKMEDNTTSPQLIQRPPGFRRP